MMMHMRSWHYYLYRKKKIANRPIDDKNERKRQRLKEKERQTLTADSLLCQEWNGEVGRYKR